MILDLDYEDITVESIFENSDALRKTESAKIIQELSTGIPVTEHRIKKQIKRHEPETRHIAQVFCGQLILKEETSRYCRVPEATCEKYLRFT